MARNIVIGVPAYRGWPWLSDALRSIQNQTHRDFEVRISVDGSDERSAECCRPFLADPRFQMIVQQTRLGWIGNANWLISRAGRDYFCYHQQDDLIEPSYYETLVAQAEREPEAAAVYSDVRWIGARQAVEAQPTIRGAPIERVLAQIANMHWIPFLGLIRSEAVAAAGLLRFTLPDSYSEDVVWIARLALGGHLVRVPQVLYLKRLHEDCTHTQWFKWTLEQKRVAWIRMCLGLLRAGLRAAQTDAERARVLFAVRDRLINNSDRRALVQPTHDAGAQRLTKDFLAQAEQEGICTVRRSDQGHVVVQTGPAAFD